MRHFIIGDIHGQYRTLRALLDVVPLQPNDTVVTLGDYIDRGPDSKLVIETLLEWKTGFRLVPLRGNHEVMMLHAREDPQAWEEWGRTFGSKTLESYCAKTPEDIPAAHWEFLERTYRSYETETHFFVHANADPLIDLDQQPDYMIYDEFFRDPPPHKSGKVMVCGHTPQEDGRPSSIGQAICIDTQHDEGGWLTCLDPVAMIYWQANDRGETRCELLE